MFNPSFENQLRILDLNTFYRYLQISLVSEQKIMLKICFT